MTELRREIGLFGGISVLAGIMIGSGIFYIGGIVLERSGMNLGLALLVWIAGGLITLMSGVCYAELGAMMPKAGGSYVYLREAYGERTAFVSGFSSFVLSASASIAALAVAFASALSTVFPMGPLAQKFLAAGTILLLTLVNIRGVRAGAAVQNVFMVLKLLPIAVILGAGLILGDVETPVITLPDELPSAGTLLSTVAFAVVATLWAYEGWTNLNTIAEEIKNPKRNIPLALILSITGVAILYVLFNYAVYRVLPFETIQQLVGSGDYYLGTAAAKELFGPAGMIVVGAAMILAIFNSLNGCIMVFPRMYFAMARDGALFPSLAKLHPTYRTPMNAQIASAVMASILVCSRTLSELTSLVALCGIIFHGLTFFSVIVLRRKYPTMERPYRVWLYPFTTILICLVMIGLALNTLEQDPVTALLGLLVPLFGLVIYELFFRRRHDALEKERALEGKDALGSE